MTHSVETHFRMDTAEYDRKIRTLVPNYETMLATQVRWLGVGLGDPTGLVVDLGGGTGALAAAVAWRYPKVLLEVWDVDKKMLEIARVRLSPYGDRVRLVERSFSDPLPPCQAVVASLALHHLRSGEEKEAVYRNVYQALKPGGIFLNADVTMNPGKEIQGLTYDEWTAFMTHHGVSIEAAKQHFSDWSSEDRYFSLSQELSWLSQAGFESPECFWKVGPSTVFGGVRNQ